MSVKCYSELMSLSTFIERYRYLKLGGSVGKETFGYDRYLNQTLYRSPEWKRFRRDIIKRSPKNFDPENVISTQLMTHNAIHYGDESLLITEPVVRKPNDTCPWKI